MGQKNGRIGVINEPNKKSLTESIKQSTIHSFKQQELPAWKPLLTPSTVLPSLFLLSISFVAIGTALLYMSEKVQQIEFDYTHCKESKSDISCAEAISNATNRSSQKCVCVLSFTLKENFTSQVYIYYALTNYYQSHRLYESSYDSNQLYGQLSSTVDSSCDAFSYKSVDGEMEPIVPCGVIANSMFNDTFNLWYLNLLNDKPNVKVPLLHTGIAWPTDKLVFRNPPGSNASSLEQSFSGFTNPPYWGNKTIWMLDPTNPDNNGLQNEALMVWMRTSGLPDFRKTYARVDHQVGSEFENSMPAGRYKLEIEYNYPVIGFKGRKRFLISNTSWMGGKNPFLGIMYIIFGCSTFFVSCFLLFIHKKYGMDPLLMILINENTPYFSKTEKRHRFSNLTI